MKANKDDNWPNGTYRKASSQWSIEEIIQLLPVLQSYSRIPKIF